MTVQSSEPSIGARIRAIRKARGIRTTRELAELIAGASVTESIIENLESGRKVNLDVSQLLNIAMALEVPATYLLAPIGNPSAPIDLPGLSEAFAGMTSRTFDSWLCTVIPSRYHPRTLGERNAREELMALRELDSVESEAERLSAMMRLEGEVEQAPWADTRERLQLELSRASRLREYLNSAGWDLVPLANDQPPAANVG